MTVKKYDANNAVELIQYAEIYLNGEIKRYISHLYKGICYVLGLEIDDKPMGFIVIERRNEANHVCNCFFISPEVRNQEYEKALLEAAIREAKTEGAEHFYISYVQKHEDADRLKKLYESFGFSPSGYKRYTYVLKREAVGAAIEGMRHKYNRFLHSYRQKISSFKGLDSQTINQIASQRGKEIPEYFYPLTNYYCPECSTMIWQDNDPAGWIVFEPNGATALYLHHLYIKEKYRNKGLFIPLLTHAYKHTPKTVKKYFFYVNGDNANMLGLLRLFSNCYAKSDVLIEMVKNLTP